MSSQQGNVPPGMYIALIIVMWIGGIVIMDYIPESNIAMRRAIGGILLGMTAVLAKGAS
ncbi:MULTISPECIES: hypothetical protein [Calothrix]|uniref:Uncharacterized protein n=2 Tax=Calothrix TaxID=1186 RepID=A0ABR8A9D8_9CYAN|nr:MULTISPECIES: hypothetical protein [Calothrix]MBD2196595.1 hypothetical protein [Calothrix parietina FACHB-288]MBD2228040.1 hypothetical protein [Calothrix anomala FACHB-343]